MSCDNCPGTVWFDHKAEVWKHGKLRQPNTDKSAELCRNPTPYFVGSR